MKIVKYVLLLLLLAAIAITVFIATQNGSYSIEKEKVINVPRPVLYSYINEYKNWENLGLLKDADSTATYTYSAAATGNGTFMQWQKNNTSGKITTTAVADNDSIRQQAVINNLESLISWKFKDTLNSTKVTIKLTGNLTFTEKANALLQGGVDNSFEKTLSKGLDNLNAFLVTELRKYEVDIEGLVTKNGTFYLGHTLSGATRNVNQKSADSFVRLQAFAKENKITVTGYPFILYKNLDKAAGTATYTFAIPIKDEIYTAPGSEYEGGKVLPYQALKTTLTGDYSHLEKAWKKAGDFINQKALKENTAGTYIEVFAKGGKQTRRPSQWQTDIYIPIGASAAPVDVMALDVPLPPINNTTSARPATTGVQPVKPAGAASKSGTTGTASKPAGSTTSTAQKPAGTAKPAAVSTGTKPATPGTTAKPSGSGTTGTAKPGTTTAKKPAPKTTTGANTTAKPKPTIEKPGEPRVDDMNPPRAED